ncbi:MAG: hypothetical protein MZU95_05405 [Desulfomicrobium escambiense]|nr:hypothetical protein [Desulfomicrobium escambiense]
MSRNNTQLLVTLDAEPDTDSEDLERLTRQLREELSELDVQADFVTGGPAPANAMAGDIIEWGTLLVTLAASGGVITTLINVLQVWLTSHHQRGLILEINGDKLQVTGITSTEQQRLIDAWVHRHLQE